MKLNKVLIFYKRSAYKLYFIDPEKPAAHPKKNFIRSQYNQLKEAHDAHYETLHLIIQVLMEHNIDYDEIYRGRRIEFDQYDLIITVGGDGTFLEASGQILNTPVLGVNSAPKFSVGRFCSTNRENFKKNLPTNS